jgi:hypothetical protein
MSYHNAIESCYITKSWSVFEETGTQNQKDNVIKKMNDYKPTYIVGNHILENICKHLIYMYMYTNYPNPCFEIKKGKWIMIRPIDMQAFPKSVKLFQFNVNKRNDGTWVREHSRIVIIKFKI